MRVIQADGSTLLPNHHGHWRQSSALWWAYLQRLKHSDAPIFVGPWLGEIGFEVLYWIPFLRRLSKQTGIDLARFIPITRGGAGAWYGTPTGVEIYGMRTPQQIRIELRTKAAKTGMLKQTTVTPFERQILRDAADSLKIQRYHVLHPAWMYTRLAPYWTMDRGLTWLDTQTQFQTIAAPEVAPTVPLPNDFVAVRFYSRATFTGKETYSFVQACVETIQRDIPVIILDSDLPLDDHMDMTLGCPTDAKVTHLRDYLPITPENNLFVMSAVLAKARGFVGTYGGFAQLALRLNVPSVSYFTDWGKTAIAHLQLAEVIAMRTGIPSHVLRVRDLPMLNTVLPEATLVPKVKSPLALQSA
jgi:hypothetical protein